MRYICVKTGFKYFIEHSTLRTWVTIDGTLTNNPHEAGIISFDEDWIAEKYLNPIEPDITSDFSGRTVRYDYAGQSLWNSVKKQIAEKNNGADLYTDFIITEHEFV